MGVFFYVQIYLTIFFWYTILMYRGLISRISFFNFFMSKKFEKVFPPKKKKIKFVWKHQILHNFLLNFLYQEN